MEFSLEGPRVGDDPGSLTAFDVSSKPIIGIPELADVKDALELRHEIISCGGRESG